MTKFNVKNANEIIHLIAKEIQGPAYGRGTMFKAARVYEALADAGLLREDLVGGDEK